VTRSCTMKIAIALVFCLIWGAAVRAQLPPVVESEIGILLTLITGLTLGISKYETPIAIRFTSVFAASFWNCVAVYDPVKLDALTSARPAVVANDTSTFTTINKAVCAAQAAVTYATFSMPGGVEDTVTGLTGINITVMEELDPALAACDSSNAATFAPCLQSVADAQGYSAAIMGQIVGLTTYLWTLDDGWNQLGLDLKDGKTCAVHCRNYSDPTGFKPSTSPYDDSWFTFLSSDHWQPLLEDDGCGFFYHQQHVTPHVGTLGKFRYIPESERATRVAPPSGYSSSRRMEARKVIQRMALLDDVKKLQIEAFDNKLLVGNVIVGSFVNKVLTDGYVDTVLGKPGLILTYDRLVHFVTGFTATEYDAVIIAWKEKVSFDLIRPTSVIKRWRGGNKNINTWAPGGVQTFKSRDFEAYIRVMPHAEYVSGSSCLFEGIKDYVDGYLAGIGLNPTSFPITFPPYAPGSSSVEPGVVPASTVVLSYPDVASMADAGSDSRLDGGMHFEQSVPAGKVVCSGIGTHAVNGVTDLLG